MKEFEALSIAECLSLHPQYAVWQIKSVHNEYLNLSTPEGLVTLVKSGYPLIPFGIEVDLKFNWHVYSIRDKQTVFQTPEKIIIDGVLSISDYDKCKRVVCRPRFNRRYDQTELARRLDIIYQCSLKKNKEGGILTYLGEYNPKIFLQREGQDNKYYGRIWPKFEALVSGIYSKNDKFISDGVCGLLGVGQGLTPSGDDFLLGFLCGLRNIGVEHCLAASEKMIEHLVTNASSRTTTLSAEYIKYGVKGFYHKRIIDFIEAFNMGSESDMMKKADDLMSLGHFSGVDIMTGFAYGGLTALHADTLSFSFKYTND